MGRHKIEQPTKTCRVDGVVFSKPPHKSNAAWEQMTCCSKKCAGTRPNENGSYIPEVKVCINESCREYFTKSKKNTHEYFKTQRYCSISCSKTGKKGEDNNSWVGDEIGYQGVHGWMKRTYGQPDFCDYCKTTERRMYHWANISGKYLRDRSDWARLCVPHHRLFDLKKIEL